MSPTTSRLGKRLTWAKRDKEKKEMVEEEWDDRWDVNEGKRGAHEALKGFEWRWGGRKASACGGVSPRCSLDGAGRRKRSAVGTVLE